MPFQNRNTRETATPETNYEKQKKILFARNILLDCALAFLKYQERFTFPDNQNVPHTNSTAGKGTKRATY